MMKKIDVAGREIGFRRCFFVIGKTALCRGRGEVVTPYPCEAKYHYILIYPKFEISTAMVYNNFKISLTKNLKNVSSFLQQLATGDPDKVGACLYNRLEEVVLRLYPGVETIKNVLAAYAFSGVLLSGSGSALYGLCKKEGNIREIEQQLKMRNVGDVFVVTNDFDDNGS